MAIRHYVYAAGIAAGLALLAACGDDVTEVTNVSEKASLDQVKKFKELPKCDEDAEGSLVYVKDSAKVFSCNGKDWVSLNGKDGSDGKDGKNGSNGDDGSGCTVKQNKAKTGFDIVCDGKKVGSVESGSDGKDGKNGSDGASCTAKQNKKKTGFDIICGGKTVGTVSNGDDGKVGDGCSLEDDGSGHVTVTCGGESVTLVKAPCGAGSYDPATQFCVEGVAYPICHSVVEGLDNYLNPDGSYDVEKYFCDATDILVSKCYGQTYDYATQFCGLYHPYDRCDTVAEGLDDLERNQDGSYDVVNYFCHKGILYKNCGANAPVTSGYTYDPETQFCSEVNTVEERCGSKKKTYHAADSMCVNGKVEYAKVCCDPGNQGTNWCRNNDHIYDKRTHFCDARPSANGRIYGYKKLTLTSDNGDTLYSKTWMTENVDFGGSTIVCLPDDENCTKGGFYTWNSAQSSCPDEWTVPEVSDYADLISVYGSNGAPYLGTGNSGFAASALGYMDESGDVHNSSTAYFWTKTESTYEGEAYYFSVNSSSALADGGTHFSKGLFLNVRCVKENEN